MIDPFSETVISFADAAKLLPKRRGGKKVHCSTIFRWASVGLRGVILESTSIGGTKCTSQEKLRLFFAALSEASGTRIPAAKPKAAEREQALADADAFCEKLNL
jgi:hypothetical protein